MVVAFLSLAAAKQLSPKHWEGCIIMTRTRKSATMTVLGLTMLMSACEGASQSPTSPTPPALTETRGTFSGRGTLSGVVFEIRAGGLVGVEGVQVYCDACGPQGHSDRYTDGSGEYHFGDTANGRHLVILGAKTGYTLLRPDEAIAGWMGGVRATVSGDSRFDIELVRQ